MLTIREYCQQHPIRQAFHTGLYGFARVHGELDLSRCMYRTAQTAGKARKAAWLEYLADEHDRARMLADLVR